MISLNDFILEKGYVCDDPSKWSKNIAKTFDDDKRFWVENYLKNSENDKWLKSIPEFKHNNKPLSFTFRHKVYNIERKYNNELIIKTFGKEVKPEVKERIEQILKTAYLEDNGGYKKLVNGYSFADELADIVDLYWYPNEI